MIFHQKVHRRVINEQKWAIQMTEWRQWEGCHRRIRRNFDLNLPVCCTLNSTFYVEAERKIRSKLSSETMELPRWGWAPPDKSPATTLRLRNVQGVYNKLTAYFPEPIAPTIGSRTIQIFARIKKSPCHFFLHSWDGARSAFTSVDRLFAGVLRALRCMSCGQHKFYHDTKMLSTFCKTRSDADVKSRL